MMRNKAPPTALSNIEKIAELESEQESGIAFPAQLAAAIGRFAGTLTFVVVECAIAAVWIVVNAGAIPPLPVFDPYPFPLLALLLTVQSVLLTAFVLIRQNQMSLKADRRSHLDLQISLLAEKETTKIIQMMDRLSSTLGMADEVTDQETKELGQVTAVETLARELDKRMPTADSSPPADDGSAGGRNSGSTS